MEEKDLIQFLKQNKQLIIEERFNELFDAFPDVGAGMHLLDRIWGKIDIIGKLKEEVPAYFGCGSSKIRSIILGNNIETIGPNAFSRSSITGIIIPESVKMIGEDAFTYCKHLKEVVLYPTLETIEGGAFSSCPNLTVTFNGDIEQWNAVDNDRERIPFDEPYKLEGVFKPEALVFPTRMGRIKNYKFAYVKNLNQISCFCRTIGDGAFYKSSVAGVSCDCQYIGEFAFQGCERLQDVFLGTKLARIKEEAFAGCTSLKKITYLGTIDEFKQVHIGSYAFENCSSLEYISCSDGIFKI